MISNTLSLKGKAALVTGASRGIGKAIALTFANAGADLVLCSRGEKGTIADAELFLASDKARTITGHTILMEGGNLA